VTGTTTVATWVMCNPLWVMLVKTRRRAKAHRSRRLVAGRAWECILGLSLTWAIKPMPDLLVGAFAKQDPGDSPFRRTQQTLPRGASTHRPH
jgi:hypothetical protein